MDDQQHQQGQPIGLRDPREIVGFIQGCSPGSSTAGQAADLLATHMTSVEACVHPETKGTVGGGGPGQDTCIKYASLLSSLLLLASI